jgi:hypothetical protein
MLLKRLLFECFSRLYGEIRSDASTEEGMSPRTFSEVRALARRFAVGRGSRLPVMLCSLVLASCASSGNKVQERKAYWERTVRLEIPPGTSKDALNKWATSRSITLAYAADRRELHGPLYYIETNDWVCKGWGLTLVITLDSNETVASETVKTYGHCL